MTTNLQPTDSKHRSGGPAVSEAWMSESRADLPEYRQWQNAMRPEDTGHSDGAAGVPAVTDPASQYEGKVRDQLNSRLGVVRNRFAKDDAYLMGEIATLRPDAADFQRFLNEKRGTLRRPVLIRLGRRPGVAATVVATLLAATLMGVLWIDKGLAVAYALPVSVFGAATLSLLAYFCGLVLRQGVAAWQKWLAMGMLGLSVTVVVAVSMNMRTPSFELIERASIGVLTAFAVSAVSAAAFMMHDPDGAYLAIELRSMRLQGALAKLEVARVENRVFHTNVARRHLELAKQMISSYRQSNSRSRSPASPQPAFFGVAPQLPEIADDWLQFLEVKL